MTIVSGALLFLGRLNKIRYNKIMFKSFIEQRLEKYVKKYFEKHPDVKLVAVSGSVGKTSTKIAIATVLSEKFRLRVEGGNHNTNLSAPLAILGIDYPKNIRNVFAWLAVFSAARRRISQPSDVDVIIQELGSDRIGQVMQFCQYLHPDIGVVTAVSPEHMEYFKTMDAVAKEELELANFSKIALINRDDIDGQYSKYLKNPKVNTYGTNATAEYHFISENFSMKTGNKGKFYAPELAEPIDVSIKVLGEHTLRPAIAAAAVALKLGMNPEEIFKGLSKIRPADGRMNILRGVENSIIIDDSYNSSPLAAMSSLRTLYSINAPQKIAILGSMNELGETSAEEHEKIGQLCDASQLDLVVTVGAEAEKYLAVEAQKNGCKVKSFSNSVLAGTYVRNILEQGAVVLCKGSEGGIYLEEAVKALLQSPEDEKYLVRQSPKWTEKKAAFFQKNS